MLAGTKAGFDAKADIHLAASTKDSDLLIASQGQGPSALRADPVSVAAVQPGSAHAVLAELSKQANSPQVASNIVDPIEQNPSRGGRTV